MSAVHPNTMNITPWIPTPEEIAERAQQVRENWSAAETAKRLGCFANPPSELPVHKNDRHTTAGKVKVGI